MKKKVLLSKASLDLVKFASKDYCRGVLRGLHLTEQYTEVSDGHILVRLPHDVRALFLPLKRLNVVLDKEDIEKVKLPEKLDNETLYIEEEKDQFVLVLSNSKKTQKIKVRTINGEYPETDYFFKEREGEVKVVLDANLLKPLVDYVIKHNDPKKKTTNPIAFYVYKSDYHVRFRFKTKDNQIGEGAIMPMRDNDI
ncbi:MAG: hypothetical protein QW051_05110 [Candidatus Aenigmatarchaeota archaeon]